jgi:hypothetical protein
MTLKGKNEREILEEFENNNFYFETADTYGEPGYQTDKLIVLGDWNSLEQKDIDFLETIFDLQWYDEWTVDSNGKCYRTQPDSYFWQPSYVVSNGEIIGMEDLVSDTDAFVEWIEDEFIDNPATAINNRMVTDEILNAVATEISSGYENGWYGIEDNPEKILEKVEGEGYFFRIDGVSQFCISFELWRLDKYK